MLLKTLIFVTFSIAYHKAELMIKSVEMRPPHFNGTALIFDIALYNNFRVKKATITDFNIVSEKCCLQLTKDDIMCDAAELIGGAFYTRIEPGNTQIVSVIWPTITLHDRIGYCDITISASNFIQSLDYQIRFNTSLDLKILEDFKKSAGNITKCETRDLIPFDRCKPVICAEKYFGEMSFFNSLTKLCERVPECPDKKGIVYDFINNECVDVKNVVTAKELRDIKSGKYVFNNNWQPKNHFTDEEMEEMQNPKPSNLNQMSVHDDNQFSDEQKISSSNENFSWIDFFDILLTIALAIILYLIMAGLVTALVCYCARRTTVNNEMKYTRIS